MTFDFSGDEIPKIEDADLGFFTSHDESSELVPDASLERLVNVYLLAAKQRDAHIVMVWPGTFSSIPLAHAMACFGLWANGYKRGARGLYYPAKRNSFYPLNHVQISRTRLIALANELIEPLGGGRNNKVKESLTDKDAFLFTVNSFRKEMSEANLRPCINEIIPHFSIEQPNQGFADYSTRFFFRLKYNAGLRERRALAKTTFPALGAPASAPDALFALGHALKSDDLDEALRAFRKIDPPDVILLDGTWKNIKTMYDWRQKFVNFIKKIRRQFKDNCPGIMVVIDEPRQMALFRVLLGSTYKETPRLGYLNQHGIVKTHVDLGMVTPGVNPDVNLPEGSIQVHVTDFDIGRVIEKFTTSAKRIEDESRSADPVWQAITFLGKLSHLPGNLENLWEYLDHHNLNPGARESFNWQYFRAGIIGFIAEGHALGERPNLENTLSQADALIRSYQANTPLGLKTLSEVRRAQDNGKRVTVVVRRRLHKEVLLAYIRKSGITPEEHMVLQVDELELLLSSGYSCDVLLFADMSPEILRRVVVDQRLPGEVGLLLTAPMAKHLKYNITPLLRMTEFRVFHPRLQNILDTVMQQYTGNGQSLLMDDGLILPTFRIGNYDTDDHSVDDKDAVYIQLDDMVVRRGTHSHMYFYDPVAADNGYSGFQSILAKNLKPGQQVFLMSTELREMIEGVLEKCGVKVGVDMPFEVGLRQYHATVIRQLNKLFSGSQTAQVRMLHDKVTRIDPTLTESETNNISHWVSLAHSQDTPFEKLAPQAPRTMKPFKAFCKALEIQEHEAMYFWDFVIKPLRGSRRKEGRWLTDVYARILFDPDSAMAYKGMLQSTIDDLRRKATENLFVVTEVVLPDQRKG